MQLKKPLLYISIVFNSPLNVFVILLQIHWPLSSARRDLPEGRLAELEAWREGGSGGQNRGGKVINRISAIQVRKESTYAWFHMCTVGIKLFLSFFLFFQVDRQS